ncbi:MAG: hypothetical protein H7831_10605, partial [Magnetococcus sp. WYHC-3]
TLPTLLEEGRVRDLRDMGRLLEEHTNRLATADAAQAEAILRDMTRMGADNQTLGRSLLERLEALAAQLALRTEHEADPALLRAVEGVAEQLTGMPSQIGAQVAAQVAAQGNLRAEHMEQLLDGVQQQLRQHGDGVVRGLGEMRERMEQGYRTLGQGLEGQSADRRLGHQALQANLEQLSADVQRQREAQSLLLEPALARLNRTLAAMEDRLAEQRAQPMETLLAEVRREGRRQSEEQKEAMGRVLAGVQEQLALCRPLDEGRLGSLADQLDRLMLLLAARPVPASGAGATAAPAMDRLVDWVRVESEALARRNQELIQHSLRDMEQALLRRVGGGSGDDGTLALRLERLEERLGQVIQPVLPEDALRSLLEGVREEIGRAVDGSRAAVAATVEALRRGEGRQEGVGALYGAQLQAQLGALQTLLESHGPALEEGALEALATRVDAGMNGAVEQIQQGLREQTRQWREWFTVTLTEQQQPLEEAWRETQRQQRRLGERLVAGEEQLGNAIETVGREVMRRVDAVRGDLRESGEQVRQALEGVRAPRVDMQPMLEQWRADGERLAEKQAGVMEGVLRRSVAGLEELVRSDTRRLGEVEEKLSEQQALILAEVGRPQKSALDGAVLAAALAPLQEGVLELQLLAEAQTTQVEGALRRSVAGLEDLVRGGVRRMGELEEHLAGQQAQMLEEVMRPRETGVDGAALAAQVAQQVRQGQADHLTVALEPVREGLAGLQRVVASQGGATAQALEPVREGLAGLQRVMASQGGATAQALEPVREGLAELQRVVASQGGATALALEPLREGLAELQRVMASQGGATTLALEPVREGLAGLQRLVEVQTVMVEGAVRRGTAGLEDLVRGEVRRLGEMEETLLQRQAQVLAEVTRPRGGGTDAGALATLLEPVREEMASLRQTLGERVEQETTRLERRMEGLREGMARMAQGALTPEALSEQWRSMAPAQAALPTAWLESLHSHMERLGSGLNRRAEEEVARLADLTRELRGSVERLEQRTEGWSPERLEPLLRPLAGLAGQADLGERMQRETNTALEALRRVVSGESARLEELASGLEQAMGTVRDRLRSLDMDFLDSALTLLREEGSQLTEGGLKRIQDAMTALADRLQGGIAQETQRMATLTGHLGEVAQVLASGGGQLDPQILTQRIVEAVTAQHETRTQQQNQQIEEMVGKMARELQDSWRKDWGAHLSQELERSSRQLLQELDSSRPVTSGGDLLGPLMQLVQERQETWERQSSQRLSDLLGGLERRMADLLSPELAEVRRQVVELQGSLQSREHAVGAEVLGRLESLGEAVAVLQDAADATREDLSALDEPFEHLAEYLRESAATLRQTHESVLFLTEEFPVLMAEKLEELERMSWDDTELLDLNETPGESLRVPAGPPPATVDSGTGGDLSRLLTGFRARQT